MCTHNTPRAYPYNNDMNESSEEEDNDQRAAIIMTVGVRVMEMVTEGKTVVMVMDISGGRSDPGGDIGGDDGSKNGGSNGGSGGDGGDDNGGASDGNHGGDELDNDGDSFSGGNDSNECARIKNDVIEAVIQAMMVNNDEAL